MPTAKKQLAASQRDKREAFYENKSSGLHRRVDAKLCDLCGLTRAQIKNSEGEK
jgi:hypothetical protein